MWKEVQEKTIDKGITWQLLFAGAITHSEKSKGFEDMPALHSCLHKHIQPCVQKHKHTVSKCISLFLILLRGAEISQEIYIKSLEQRLVCCRGNTSGNSPHRHVTEKKGAYCQCVFWLDLE